MFQHWLFHEDMQYIFLRRHYVCFHSFCLLNFMRNYFNPWSSTCILKKSFCFSFANSSSFHCIKVWKYSNSILLLKQSFPFSVSCLLPVPRTQIRAKVKVITLLILWRYLSVCYKPLLLVGPTYNYSSLWVSIESSLPSNRHKTHAMEGGFGHKYDKIKIITQITMHLCLNIQIVFVWKSRRSSKPLLFS